MNKVQLIFECNSETEAKVIGLELLNQSGVSPTKIKSTGSIIEWDTRKIIKDISNVSK